MFATLSPHESTTTSNRAVPLSKQDRGISQVETVHEEKQRNKAGNITSVCHQVTVCYVLINGVVRMLFMDWP